MRSAERERTTRPRTRGDARVPARRPAAPQGTARPVPARPPARERVPGRAERQRAARTRRTRLLLVLAVVVSVALLVAWFPGAQLLRQRHQLAATNAQLSRLDHENAALARRAKQLQTAAAVSRIAAQQYDLVPAGEQGYQVLPKSGAGGSSSLATSGGSTHSSHSSGGSAQPSSGSGSGAAQGAGVPSTFAGRVLQTLEFWR